MTLTDVSVDKAQLDAAQKAAERKAREKKEFTDGLRDLADFLDLHPELIGTGETFYTFVRKEGDETSDETVERFRTVAALLREPKINSDGCYYNATMYFGPHSLQVTMARSVIDTNTPPHPLA